MPTISVNYSLTIGGHGVTSTKTFTVDADTQNAPTENIPALKTGTLTTRTSDTAGIITSSTHGIPDTATIALVWSGGYRYDVDIDSVATDTITFSGGIGDNLPTTTTAISVCRGLQIDFNVNGTNIQALASGGSQRTLSSFLDDTATPVSVLFVDVGANEKFMWYEGNGTTNPVTGHNLTAINIYNTSATAATYSVTAGYNNTLDQVV